MTDAINRAATAIGETDMGPGISLRAALRTGMEQYYPDNPKGCAGCVEWALRRAARRGLASAGRNPKGEDPQGLRAEHEHAVPSGTSADAQNTEDENGNATSGNPLSVKSA